MKKKKHQKAFNSSRALNPKINRNDLHLWEYRYWTMKAFQTQIKKSTIITATKSQANKKKIMEKTELQSLCL